MYREYIPPESEKYLSVLVVTPQASHGVHEYQRAIKQGYCEESALLEDLEFQDPQLHDVIAYFIEDFGMEEREAELFSIGFAVTYTALSYQTELMGGSLPMLGEHIVQGYTADLQILEDEALPCIKEALENLRSLNPHLIDCWEEYIIGQDEVLSSGEVTAFTMGGMMAHDLMTQQINSDQLLLTYAESLN